MLKGFKEFILRGNVIDLAVGVMIGAAFNTLVQSLVKDLLTPLIAAIVKQPDFSTLTFTLNGSKFLYGDLLNAIISFFIVAITVYFFVVLPLNKLMERMQRGKEKPSPAAKQCPECLSTIPIAATRCAHCAIKLPITG
ncbi:MAG TPA: large conductance mechanosensitive channel protein MscL [Candidatus Paceibacterota bacterium]|nr:large conductance mechanosensitive channel protein MscL [Candidatus Paceibacterota bacterium]